MKKSIEVPIRTAYSTLGKLNEHTRCIWVVCHGYGQLAETFIEHFQCLNLQEHFIIAPEGIAKFYLKAFTGQVGATWMTSHDREWDIGNYVSMLSAIYKAETANAPLGCRTILLGFSQGAAAISRWAMYSDIDFHALTLWGGRFPPDVDQGLAQQKLEGKDFTIYIGNRDKYIDASQRDEHTAYMRRKGLFPEVHLYEGGHTLYDDALLAYAATVAP